MAPTITEMIATTERRKIAYERAISDAKAALKQFDGIMPAQENKEAIRELVAEQRIAVDAARGLEAELNYLRATKDEDAAADEAAKAVYRLGKDGVYRDASGNARPGSAPSAPGSSGGSGETRTYNGDGTMLYGAAGSPAAPEWRYANTGRNAALAPGQSWRDNEAVREYAEKHAERDKIIVGTH